MTADLAPLMRSTRQTWNTPAVVLDRVRRFAPIALDPCSNATSIVGARARLSLPKHDGLKSDWSLFGGLVFVNSPYGREIGAWMAKCWTEHTRNGTEIIALVPARTDTRWWIANCSPPASTAVCFWRGRLTFLGAPAGAPFPSALIYWGRRGYAFRDCFESAGAVWVST